MSTKETITMTLREAERLEIINNLISKSITGTEAGKQLGLSLRQTKRLKAKVKQLGFQGVIHGNRGKKSNNKLGEKVLARIKSLLKSKYH